MCCPRRLGLRIYACRSRIGARARGLGRRTDMCFPGRLGLRSHACRARTGARTGGLGRRIDMCFPGRLSLRIHACRVRTGDFRRRSDMCFSGRPSLRIYACRTRTGGPGRRNDKFWAERLRWRSRTCRTRTGARVGRRRRRGWLARIQVTCPVFGLLLNPVVCVAPHLIPCQSFEVNKRSVYSIFPSFVSGLLRFRLGQTTKQLALIIDVSRPDDGDWIVSPCIYLLAR